MPGAWGAASHHTSLEMPSFPRTNVALTNVYGVVLDATLAFLLAVPFQTMGGCLLCCCCCTWAANTQSHTRNRHPWRFPDIRLAFFFFFVAWPFCSGGGVGTGCREPGQRCLFLKVAIAGAYYPTLQSPSRYMCWYLSRALKGGGHCRVVLHQLASILIHLRT